MSRSAEAKAAEETDQKEFLPKLDRSLSYLAGTALNKCRTVILNVPI